MNAPILMQGYLGGSVLLPLMVVFVVFVTTGAAFFALYTILFPKRSAADRLEQLAAADDDDPSGGSLEARKTPAQQFFEQFTIRLGEYAATNNQEEIEKVQNSLKYAGYKNRRSLEIFNGVRVVGAFALPVLVSPMGFVMTPQGAAMLMIMMAALGYYGPLIYVTSRAQERQASMLRGFPDALDLLVSCVESGLDLTQSFRRVSEEMRKITPQLAREFVFVTSEINAGIDKITALKHLEERTGLKEIRSLVNMLAQADRYGTSVADALRVYSQVYREKRAAGVEEAAGAVGSKVTIVMIVFFLPVLFVMLLAPTVIRIIFGESGA